MIPDRTQQKGSNQPILTVALPVYNGVETLVTAIRSLLNQSFRDFELIILDDNSQDESVGIVRSFKDCRIKVVEGDQNIGLSARLNMAVDMANGKYFARMDQDDIAFPDRFLKQVNYLEMHCEVDLLGSSVLVFSGDGVVNGVLPVKLSHDGICERPWNGFHLPHPTWMGRIGWFRMNKYDSCADGAEDQQLLYRTYQTSCFACIKEPLLAYREARSFKKMFKARRILITTFVKVAYRRNEFGIIAKVLLVQSIKVVADVLNQIFKILVARNVLLPPEQGCISEWRKLWDKREG